MFTTFNRIYSHAKHAETPQSRKYFAIRHAVNPHPAQFWVCRAHTDVRSPMPGQVFSCKTPETPAPMTPPAYCHDEIDTTKSPRTLARAFRSGYVGALFDQPPRPDDVGMNDRNQLASRKGSGTVKNKPPTTPAPDSLKPQRPTPRTDRAISPAKPWHDGQTTGNYRKTASPAPMPQRIKPRTRETVDPISHDTPTRGQPSKHPTTATRSQRHRQRNRPTTNRSTQPPRRLAVVLAPVQ